MEIGCDFDDFGPLNHRFDLLDELRLRYPKFKVTMFTIPWDIRLNPADKGTPITLEKFKPWVDEVRQGVKAGWLDICLHGLTHLPAEFNKFGYDEARQRIIAAEKMFDFCKIPLTKMFKAPYWLISDKAKLAVKDMGYTLVEDGYYNFNLANNWPIDAKTVIMHGHVQDVCGNGMEESLSKIMKAPRNAKWVFLKEMYEHIILH